MLNNNKIAAKQVCFTKFSITFAKRIKQINDERYKSNKSRVGYQYATTDLCTIEYLGEWEKLYNPNFNCTEFDTIRNAAGSNNFVLSVKAWIQRTGAIGIMAKAGRYLSLIHI